MPTKIISHGDGNSTVTVGDNAVVVPCELSKAGADLQAVGKAIGAGGKIACGAAGPRGRARICFLRAPAEATSVGIVAASGLIRGRARVRIQVRMKSH